MIIARWDRNGSEVVDDAQCHLPGGNIYIIIIINNDDNNNDDN